MRWFDDAPYSFRAPDGQVRGFDADLAREVLRRMGCSPRFVEMPWARALVELEAGRLDILPGALPSKERARFAHFSVPALESPNVLYLSQAAEAAYRPAQLDELLGTSFRLGVQRGVSYGERFEALKANPRFQSNLVPISLRRSAWKMMAIGRIDGMIADQASAQLELQQLGLTKVIRSSGIVVSTTTAVFAFSQRTVPAAFVAAFDRQLEATLADGQYRSLRERYLGCTARTAVLGCR